MNEQQAQTHQAVVAAPVRRAGFVSSVVVALVFGILPGALAVTVTVTPDKQSRPEPGGTFNYTVEVSDCDFGAAGCTLESLEDSIYGDLDGQGSCATGGDFGMLGSETYTCTFPGRFIGVEGDGQTNEVTAEGVDLATGLVPFDGSGSSTVSITEGTRFSLRAAARLARSEGRSSRYAARSQSNSSRPPRPARPPRPQRP